MRTQHPTQHHSTEDLGLVESLGLLILGMLLFLPRFVLAGFAIGRIPNVERGVEDFVWQVHMSNVAHFGPSPTWTERFQGAWQNTRSIVSKVWPFVVVGIAAGTCTRFYVKLRLRRMASLANTGFLTPP